MNIQQHELTVDKILKLYDDGIEIYMVQNDDSTTWAAPASGHNCDGLKKIPLGTKIIVGIEEGKYNFHDDYDVEYTQLDLKCHNLCKMVKDGLKLYLKTPYGMTLIEAGNGYAWEGIYNHLPAEYSMRVWVQNDPAAHLKKKS